MYWLRCCFVVRVSDSAIFCHVTSWWDVWGGGGGDYVIGIADASRYLQSTRGRPASERMSIVLYYVRACIRVCVCVCACTRMGRRVWVCVHAGVCVRVCMPAFLSARVTRNQPATTRFAYNNVHDTVVIAANASNCFTCG